MNLLSDIMVKGVNTGPTKLPEHWDLNCYLVRDKHGNEVRELVESVEILDNNSGLVNMKRARERYHIAIAPSNGPTGI